MIESTNCCSLGVETTDMELCAWVLQYEDGPLGMLFCLEEYRRKGFARALVERITKSLSDGGSSKAFSYIVDGNRASENLFLALGWERRCDANWVGFSSEVEK